MFRTSAECSEAPVRYGKGPIVIPAHPLWYYVGSAPSEAVMDDGTIIASLIGTGVAGIPIDYDTASTLQIIVDLPPADMTGKWENFLKSRVGRPPPRSSDLLFILTSMSKEP